MASAGGICGGDDQKRVGGVWLVGLAALARRDLRRERPKASERRWAQADCAPGTIKEQWWQSAQPDFAAAAMKDQAVDRMRRSAAGSDIRTCSDNQSVTDMAYYAGGEKANLA